MDEAWLAVKWENIFSGDAWEAKALQNDLAEARRLCRDRLGAIVGVGVPDM